MEMEIRTTPSVNSNKYDHGIQNEGLGLHS